MLLAADADRGIGPRDQKRAWKTTRAHNIWAAEARVIARTADLGRTRRRGAVGAGDWLGGRQACRHRLGAAREQRERDS